MAAELFIGSWSSRSVAMVGACLRLTGNKAKLAVSPASEQKLVLTDGTVLKQTKSMLLKLVELAGGAYTKTLLGADALERAQVSQWMEYTSSKCSDKNAAEDSVQNLNAHFQTSTFLALERMTMADLVLYHALYPYISEAPPTKMKSHIPSVCRWFDLVQHNEFFKVRDQSNYVPPLVQVALRTDSAPPSGWNWLTGGTTTTSNTVVRSSSSNASETKSSAAPAAAPVGNAAAPAATPAGNAAQQNAPKASKKEKAKGGGGGGKGKGKAKGGKKGGKPAAASDNAAPIDPSTDSFFYSIDLRVGKILKAWPHPDSDHLWCEEIDVGEEKPRQIASGLRDYYPKQEEMENRMVVVVCNLKARKLAGFSSNGMVCCGVLGEGDARQVELVEAPAGAKPGDRLIAHGVLGEGVELLTAAAPNKVQKKKVFEKFAPDFKTNADKQVVWRGFPLCVAPGTFFTVPTIANGQVS